MPKPPNIVPALGLYSYAQAVEDIARDFSLSEEARTSLLLDMAGAIRSGALIVRKWETGAPYPVRRDEENPSSFVRVSDVNAWLREHDIPFIWNPAKAKVAQSRQVVQEQVILGVLSKLNVNCQQLPKSSPGKSGIKAEVRKIIGSNGMWSSQGVFDKAWERLRNSGQLADQN
jgi:hypothetical protein